MSEQPKPSACRFVAGQIVDHAKFGYRGVVFRADPVFSLSQEWYEEVAKSRPPQDAPWYHVLVDGAMDELHTTYVAERHLTLSANLQQVDHPALGRYFRRFDGTRYFVK